jgi:hypothetical protein
MSYTTAIFQNDLSTTTAALITYQSRNYPKRLKTKLFL